MLWKGNNEVSEEYADHFFDDLERFCISQQSDIKTLIHAIYMDMNLHTAMPPKQLLQAIEPHFHMLYTTNDIYKSILGIINEIMDTIFPGCVCESGGFFNNKTSSGCLLLFTSDNTIHTRLQIDPELWICPIIKHIPRIFGLPEFITCETVADSRPVKSIINAPYDKIDYAGDLVYINNEPFGTTVTFDSLLKNIEPTQVINNPFYFTQPIKILRDFFSESKKRVVLHKGCSYETPYSLFRLTYPSNVQSPENILKNLISQITLPSELIQSVKSKHQIMLDSSKKKYYVNYDHKTQTFSIDNILFLSGIQARIAKKIIHAHITKKQDVFKFKEIKNDPMLNLDPKNPNIELHLKRINQHLKQHFPALSLEKTVKGEVKLNNGCELEYNETGN